MSQSKQAAIIGGGLVGCLFACFLARRNYTVHVYEKRKDMRQLSVHSGKSINLALSNRARKALRAVDLEDIILQCAVPMEGRLIHDYFENTTYFDPYDFLNKQCLYSVNRNYLNKVLLTAAEKTHKITIFFEHELLNSDIEKGILYFKNLKTRERLSNTYDFIIGADGAHSTLRKDMQQHHLFSFSQEYIQHGYIELSIEEGNGKCLRSNCLHIWPRGTFMMIALPNSDSSWTVTLFMPFEKFDQLKNSNSILEFFRNTFPDSIALLGEEQIIRELKSKTPRALVSISCKPFHVGDKAVLIGDAAHAMVPFYGQGANAGFEDCLILNDILKLNGDDIKKSVEEFTYTRSEDAHAICKLSLYNYEEMRDLVTRKSYRLRKFLDEILYFMMPRIWIPLYISITFLDMTYQECLANRKWQNGMIKLTVILVTILGTLLCWLLTI